MELRYHVLEISPAGFVLEFEMSVLRIVKSMSRVEKTNKSELLNHLTYRGLIYIFEVGMKTFFLN